MSLEKLEEKIQGGLRNNVRYDELLASMLGYGFKDARIDKHGCLLQHRAT